MKARIFIVEDEMILNKHLSNFLSSHGYTVEMASRGEECLEKLKSLPLPDLILMDINLGKNRMDGPRISPCISIRHRFGPFLAAWTALSGNRLGKHGKIDHQQHNPPPHQRKPRRDSADGRAQFESKIGRVPGQRSAQPD